MNVNDYLSKFYKGTKTPTLDAMLFFMEKLGHPEKKLKESNLFSTFSHVENDDIFTGHFEDITYNVAETTIAKGCSKIDSRIFKGVIITLPANKKFKTKINKSY